MKTVLLVGTGRFGTQIAEELNRLGHEVMVIDKSEEKVNKILSLVTNAQIGDSTDVEFLKTIGVRNFDLCIVAIANDFQSSLETTSLLRELGAKFIVSRAERDVQEKFLLRNGADEVVNPEKQVARWTARRFSADHILDYIELDDTHSIYEVTIPKNWLGKSIGEIDIRKKYNINILALKESGKMNAGVTPDTVLTEDKTLLVLGEHKALQKCFHI